MQLAVFPDRINEEKMSMDIEIPARKTLVASMTWVTSSTLVQEGEKKSFVVKIHDGTKISVVLTREGDAVIARLEANPDRTLQVAESESEIYVKF